MAKILNLDAVAQKEVRELRLGGVSYAVKEMSVADFIETSKIAQRMEKETDFAVQMTETVKLIKRAVPEINTSALEALTLEQLFAVSRFVRGDDPEEIARALEGEKKQEGADAAGNP